MRVQSAFSPRARVSFSATPAPAPSRAGGAGEKRRAFTAHRTFSFDQRIPSAAAAAAAAAAARINGTGGAEAAASASGRRHITRKASAPSILHRTAHRTASPAVQQRVAGKRGALKQAQRRDSQQWQHNIERMAPDPFAHPSRGASFDGGEGAAYAESPPPSTAVPSSSCSSSSIAASASASAVASSMSAGAAGKTLRFGEVVYHMHERLADGSGGVTGSGLPLGLGWRELDRRDTSVEAVDAVREAERAAREVEEAEDSEEYEPFRYELDGKLEDAERRALLREWWGAAGGHPEFEVAEAEGETDAVPLLLREMKEVRDQRRATQRSVTGLKVLAGEDPDEVAQWEVAMLAKLAANAKIR
jgi:hypothetical protein